MFLPWYISTAALVNSEAVRGEIQTMLLLTKQSSRQASGVAIPVHRLVSMLYFSGLSPCCTPDSNTQTLQWERMTQLCDFILCYIIEKTHVSISHACRTITGTQKEGVRESSMSSPVLQCSFSTDILICITKPPHLISISGNFTASGDDFVYLCFCLNSE